MSQNTTYNALQSSAISFGYGAALICAGPGTGKTTVLTERIRRLIEGDQKISCEVNRSQGRDIKTMVGFEPTCPLGCGHGVASPEEILVLTFTRAAAREMEERFHRKTDHRYPEVTFGTFHSFFWKILSVECGYTADRILSEEGQRELMREALRQMHLHQEASVSTVYTSEELQNYVDKLSSYRIAGRVHKRKMQKQRPELKELDTLYAEVKKEAGKVDYDDMAFFCYTWLKEHPDRGKVWQERFRFLLVDEFQDSATRFAIKSCDH